MTLVDAATAEAHLRRHAAGRRRAAAARRPTPAPWRRRWARAWRISARSPTTSWARCSATTCARSACISRPRRCVGGAPTARCLILVTPDGQRTMNTFLGACVSAERGRRRSRRWWRRRGGDLPGGLPVRPAGGAGGLPPAAAAAHAAGRQVALSLSDAFCVDRHRAAFRELVAGHVDILFANEAEITALYEENNFDGGGRGGPRATWRWPR